MSNTPQIRNSTAEFLIFTKQAKEDGIEVRLQNSTIWLSQKLMATLFECSTDNISLHLKNIFNEKELNEIVSETKKEEEELREQVKSLESLIEERLLAAFKRIRKNARNGLAVVVVQRDACGGCFNKIPVQRQLDIRLRKKIIVCEYCGRLLIDPELAESVEAVK